LPTLKLLKEEKAMAKKQTNKSPDKQTKGAIHAFTKSLAQQLVEEEIRVNCVAPGPI